MTIFTTGTYEYITYSTGKKHTVEILEIKEANGRKTAIATHDGKRKVYRIADNRGTEVIDLYPKSNRVLLLVAGRDKVN